MGGLLSVLVGVVAPDDTFCPLEIIAVSLAKLIQPNNTGPVVSD
jgi:hypothetical protein